MTIQTATDPKTNKTVALVDGSWKAVSQTATDKSGQKAFLVDNAWVTDAAPVQEKKPSWLDRHGRELATTAGSLIGGAMAMPAAAASAPSIIGPVAIEAGAVGIGNAMGGAAYDTLMQALGNAKRPTLQTQLATNVKDVAGGAMAVPAGRVVGAVAAPAGRVVGAVAAPVIKAAAPAVRTVMEAIPGNPAKANRLAQSLIETAKTAATQRAAASGASVEANQAIARQAEDKAAQLAQTKPAKVNRVGQVRETPADIGGPLQRTSTTENRNLITQRKQADTVLRTTRDQIVADNEAKGIKITDVPTYKDAVQTLSGWRTAPGKAPDPSVQKVYQGILERISPQQVELSAQEAAEAAKQGVKIIQAGGKNYREFNPTFENVDSARRFLGEVFSGRVEGYGAISAIEKQKLYGVLKKIEDEFVGAAQPRLQANWRTKTNELENFDTKIGKKLTGPQPGTDTPSQTPEAIANAAFGGTTKGAADYDQLVAALRGNERVARKAASDYLATNLEGKNYSQAAATVNRLRPMLKNERLAGLLSRTDSYLSQLQKSESAIAAGAAETKTAATASTAAARARINETNNLNAITDLVASQKTPQDGAKAAMAYFEKLSRLPVERGGITPSEYAKIKNQYSAIDFSKPEAARAAIAKNTSRILKLLAVAGLGAAGYKGAERFMGGGPSSVVSAIESQ